MAEEKELYYMERNYLKKIHLEQLTLQEADDGAKYKLLGEAGGENLDICIFEGVRHCKNFAKRAKAYCVTSQKKVDGRNVLRVKFYEENKK